MSKARRKYIITAAQSCYYANKDGDEIPWGDGKTKAKPHTHFLEGLETASKELGAELVIVPIAGKNTREDILHEDLADREDVFYGSLKRLNQNVQLRDLVVPPQNVDPTTGKNRDISIYNSSIIFPHSKQRFRPVPVFNASLPRYLMTTGCVTLPNYNVANHRGDQAERDHVFGAILVEVIDDVFYNVRNLLAQKNGKFVELGQLFAGDKSPKKVGTDTLVLGDIHFGDHDERTQQANYEMIDFFRPKNLILHDFFNGHSVNHHESTNSLRRVREFKRGRLSLEEELKADYQEVVSLAKAVSPGQVYVVSSNHHAFLSRYINERDWQNNEIWNAEIASYLFEGAIKLDIPEEQIDDSSYLIEYGMRRFGDIPSNVHFLRARDDMRRHGYQLASHGDKGSGGSRGGTAKSKEVLGGGKSISGHTHKMEIVGTTYIVGTSAKLDLPYTAGYGSASIAANAVLYDNGTVQMLPIISGKWRAKD